MNRAAWHQRRVRVGPFGFELRSPIRAIVDQVDWLYRDYPAVPADEVIDYTVAVRPVSAFRRYARPKLILECDIELPMTPPVPRHHAVLALEMGMNVQLAAGMARLLLLHAGAVARGGDALLMSGNSGAGKSTLAAILGHKGWRFLGDEFALLDPASGELQPFPRPISLKNESIALLEAIVPDGRVGPTIAGTIKGIVRHLVPPVDSIAAMHQTARPKLLVVPAFTAGAAPGARRLPEIEVFTQLSQSSTNYGKLGEAGFEAVSALAERLPAYEIVYSSTEAALELIENLWSIHD